MMEIFLILFGLVSGLGVPIGMTPGEEDPRMSQLAPESCFMYASWASIERPDPEDGEADHWMAKPKVFHFVKKFRRGMLAYLLTRYNRDRLEPGIQKLSSDALLSVCELACSEASAVYVRNAEFEKDDLPRLQGAAVIRLGEHQERIAKKLIAWRDAIAKLKNENGITAIEIDGAKAIQADRFERLEGFGVEKVVIVIVDDFVIIATSIDEVAKIKANLKTPAPQWLQDLRSQFKVDRFASVSYLDWETTIAAVPERFKNSGGFRFDEMLKQAKTVGTVVGVDKSGCVMQTKIVTNNSERGIFDLFPAKPLTLAEIHMVPNDKVFAMAGRMVPEGVMTVFRDLASRSPFRRDVEKAVAQVEEFTGDSLKQQVQKSVGDLLAFQLDIPSSAINGVWRVDVSIKDPMTFPDVFRQVNLKLEESVNDRLGGQLIKQKIDGLTYYSVKSKNQWQQPVGWVLEDQRLRIGSMGKKGENRRMLLLTEELPLPKERQLAEEKRVQSLFELGERENWGPPVAVLQLNLGLIFKRFGTLFDGLTNQNDEVFPETDFYYSDIPKSELFHDDTRPNLTALYRVDDGFIIRQNQTCPSSSPITTLAFVFFGELAGALQ